MQIDELCGCPGPAAAISSGDVQLSLRWAERPTNALETDSSIEYMLGALPRAATCRDISAATSAQGLIEIGFDGYAIGALRWRTQRRCRG